jgi:hypothetical protein
MAVVMGICGCCCGCAIDGVVVVVVVALGGAAGFGLYTFALRVW